MSRPKYQTIEVTFPVGKAPGRYTTSEQLDDNYSHCDGVKVIELGSGGIAYYNIGIEDKREVYHSISHKENFICGSQTPINHRYKEIDITIVKGDKIEIKTELPSELTAELKYQIEFRLRKK